MITERITKARRFAAAAHAGQVRKYTGEPYIVHPAAVARLVEKRGGTENQIIAALLHDTVEDTDVTINDIRRHFGHEVYIMVNWLTDEYTKEKYPQWNRAKRKAAEARRIGRAPREVQEVKLCDLMDNTKTIVEHDPGFATVYLPEKAMVLEAMGYTMEDAQA